MYDDERYRAAYQVSRSIRGMATAVKVLGSIAGVLIIALTILYIQSVGGHVSDEVAGSGFLLGIGTLASALVTGNLLAAQGHMLLAVLDTAVHTAPQSSFDRKLEATQSK
jgi:hypothetical protein